MISEIAAVGVESQDSISWYKQLSLNDKIRDPLSSVNDNTQTPNRKTDPSLRGLNFVKSLMREMQSRLNASGYSDEATQFLDPLGISKLENSNDIFSTQRNLETVFDKMFGEKRGFRNQQNAYSARDRFSNTGTSILRTNSYDVRRNNPYKLVNDLKARSNRNRHSVFFPST